MSIVYAKPSRLYRKSRRFPERLAAWLKWYQRQSKESVWVTFKPELLSKALGCSERTLWRAKKYLNDNQDWYGLKFVTLRKGNTWKVLYAMEERLKYDKLPLLFAEDGSIRHCRNHLYEENFQAENSFEEKEHTDNHNTIRRKSADKLLNASDASGDCLAENGKKSFSSEEIVDESEYWFNRYYEKIYNPATQTGQHGLKGDEPRVNPSIHGKSDSKGNMRLNPVERKRKKSRWFHAVARKLSSHHWENCKVFYHHRSCVSVVRRLLTAGITPRQIIATYDYALRESHGIATDIGISMQEHNYKMSPSRLYKLMYTELGFQRCDTDKGEIFVRVD